MNIRNILFLLLIPQALLGAGVPRSEAWLNSENAAGLQFLSSPNSSFAEAYFVKKDGQFINYYHSDNSYEWGALTEAYFRLNPQTVFYGKVHYANFTGQNMGGSVFIHPDDYPFNIVELTDGELGTKNREDYHLIGAVSARLSEKWAIGGKIDYLTTNYTKYKDLRHINQLLDLTATAGLSCSFGERLDIGMNYFYRRSIESILFKTVGNTDKLYFSLIDFGAFYGRKEVFGSGGQYTRELFNNPVFNELHGASLQLNVKFSPQWSFFNELAYKSQQGYYGEKSTATAVFTEHHAAIISYGGTLSYKKIGQQHDWKLSAKQQHLENNENILELTSSLDGGQEYIYYGSIQMLDRTVSNVNVVYTGIWGIKEALPTWTLQAGSDFYRRRLMVSLFPFYRKQNIHSYDAYLSVDKNTMIDRKSSFGITLGALYGSGGGVIKEDGVVQTPSENQKPPTTTDFNLNREYGYLTASRLQGNVGITCSRLLNPTVRGYIRANYELSYALNGYLKHQKQQTALLAVGCNF